ncbi:MAG: GNAT family N-acetyltransferase [Ruminococcus sp.]|nr:GNAT family N-acetyltransferase [Ruminococcus sp.]
MKLAEGLSEKELKRIKYVIGDAFVTNELFHELGSTTERRQMVLKYMDAYVEYVYESKALYMTDDKKGFIGLMHSKEQAAKPMLKMLARIVWRLPYGKLKKMLGHISQIADENKQYAKEPHIDVLMVAVDKRAQGKGYARELVDFAKDMAKERSVPLLIDTDMQSYAEMYQHFGCELYNTKTADNGVTRYNLIWKP